MVRVLALLAVLAGCGEAPGNDYPPQARARFAQACPTGDPRCDCMWDAITRKMTHAEFEAAMTRFSAEGLMDPRMTAARLECREKV